MLAMIAVFVAWTVMDFIIHNIILSETYAATAQLWRPIEDRDYVYCHPYLRWSARNG